MSDKHESDRWRLPAELAAVEKQLAALTPAGPRIDRDRLMFEAGRAAAEAELLRPAVSKPVAHVAHRGRRHWFWPAATAMMTAASVLLAVMLVRQGDRTPVAQVAHVSSGGAASKPSPAAPSIDPDAEKYYMLAASRGAWPLARVPTGGYLADRYVALTAGVDALASRQPRAAVVTSSDVPSGQPQPPTARKLLQQMLPDAMPNAS